MSTPFLQGYARSLIAELLDRELLELVDDRIDDVVVFVADFMARNRSNQSLISLTARALVESPHVAELYADDEALKDAVDALAK